MDLLEESAEGVLEHGMFIPLLLLLAVRDGCRDVPMSVVMLVSMLRRMVGSWKASVIGGIVVGRQPRRCAG